MQDLREKTVIADGMCIDWDAPIEMDDGVVLRADVYRPINEAHKYPAIMSLGAWGKNRPFSVGGVSKRRWAAVTRKYPEIMRGTTGKYQTFEVVDPEKFVPHGFACVRVDARGTGRSPGRSQGGVEPRLYHDLYYCIEWAAGQPWCNGKVGLSGISRFASIQWKVAGLQPPHLAAICPWEGAADFYRDVRRHGGIMVSVFGDLDRRQGITGFTGSFLHGLGERGPTDPNSGLLAYGPETLTDEELLANREDPNRHVAENQLDGPWYRERSADWSKVTVPLLSAGNWTGSAHPRGNFEGFVGAASKQKWLDVHGFEHDPYYYTDYGVNLQRRFFEFFLTGIDNGWDRQPRVRLQVRHPGDRYVERHENEWPIARTQWTKLYLDASRRMLQRTPAAAERKIEYKAMSGGVTFVSSAFKRETEITGPLALKLFLASSTADADVFAVLRGFDPNGDDVDFQGAYGAHTPLATGWLRASHRKLDRELSTEYRPYHSHDEIQLLRPGEVYELDVEIWPTCIVLPAGFRIGLTLLGKDFEPGQGAAQEPCAIGTPFPGGWMHNVSTDRPREIFDNTHTIYTGGERSSYLLLPFVPPRD